MDSHHHLFAEMPLQIEQLMREIYRLHCGWILELSEVDHYFNRKQIENFKNLVSTRVDEVRFPYERLPSKLARRFIMIGTTNRSQFLIDCSGTRRFVPIEVTDGFQVPWQRLCMERDNLWSSAIRAYKAKTQYEFTSGEIANISTYVNSFSEAVSANSLHHLDGVVARNKCALISMMAMVGRSVICGLALSLQDPWLNL